MKTSGPHEVGELVKMDPSFSAELLRLANSALFGARREVTSLTHAIMMVGTDRVKTMATMVAVNRMVRTSVRSASVAESVDPQPGDRGHRGRSGAGRAVRLATTRIRRGLLHNLGTLGLMSAYPAEYSRMLEVNNDFGFDLLRTERDLFEIDHCAAGAYLARDWDFPEELAAAIATHHDEPVAGDLSLDNLVRVSWRLSDTLGYAAFSPDRVWTYDELIAFVPNARACWLGESAEVAKQELNVRLSAAPI